MRTSEPRGWVKGQSGHPKGRRIRAKGWADLLRRIGHEQVSFDDDGEVTVMTREERLARTLWTRALDGDLKAAQMLLAAAREQAARCTATVSLTLEDLAGPQAARTPGSTIDADDE